MAKVPSLEFLAALQVARFWLFMALVGCLLYLIGLLLGAHMILLFPGALLVIFIGFHYHITLEKLKIKEYYGKHPLPF